MSSVVVIYRSTAPTLKCKRYVVNLTIDLGVDLSKRSVSEGKSGDPCGRQVEMEAEAEIMGR
jgi:hypothetical protein